MNDDFSSDASIIDRKNYINDADWSKLQEFIQDKNPPFLVLSREKAISNYKLLESLSN
jgi:hypothetical protein